MPSARTKRLYMFAIMPPANLAERIDCERHYFAEKYNSRAALKPPVHITVFPPFWDTDDLPERVKGLHEWAKTRVPVDIELRNFDWFDNRRSPVLYIYVARSRELADLHAAFIVQLKNMLPEVELMNEYKPHFTIGYRDIPEELLPQIREEYATRPFEGTFKASSIFLWEHDGSRWNVIGEYCFRGESSA
ncbi:MAG: 2'-5' RNA ligase family protein [Taibaiella sp.]|nr:2'-5' RNA ligase family protein [Taibaiella sp.]